MTRFSRLPIGTGCRAMLRYSLSVLLTASLSACTALLDDHRWPDSYNQSRVQRAVDSVRVAMEDSLQNLIPSLNVFIQTPTETFFASSVPPGNTPLPQNVNFRFASNTKTFTSTAILKMDQDGWLNYKAKITDLIPGTQLPYVPNTPAWNIPYKSNITIEKLLQHVAGIYDIDNDPVPGYGGQSYTAYTQAADPMHQFTAEELISQLTIHQLAYHPPNNQFHYSNTGYTMLGYIIARVYSIRSNSTKTYQDYLTDHIVGPGTRVPLDLHFPVKASDTVLPFPRIEGMERLPGQTILYGDYNMSAQVAEGNGYGSPASLNAFVRSLMKGRNVLTESTVKLMQSDIGDSSHDQYRLGCILIPNMGYGHNGERTGYLSLMAYDPFTDVSVVAYISVIDKTQGVNPKTGQVDGHESYLKCFKAVYYAAWAARAALGYPSGPR